MEVPHKERLDLRKVSDCARSLVAEPFFANFPGTLGLGSKATDSHISIASDLFGIVHCLFS
jgi:hypothetical protein